MKINKFLTVPIRGYQYISAMFPANCRYYPTCSEYAKWCFEYENSHKALIDSMFRIARCNQLFAGGIDYPNVSYTPPTVTKLYNRPLFAAFFCNIEEINDIVSPINIKYWLIPKDDKKYFVVKDIYETAICLK